MDHDDVALECPGRAAVTCGESIHGSMRLQLHNRDRTRVAWLHEGDVQVRELASGRHWRVTGSSTPATDLQFMADGEAVSWLEGGQHWIHHPDSGLTRQASDIRFEKKPQPILQQLLYFFLLPNIVFTLFPVVDYKIFGKSCLRGNTKLIGKKRSLI